jgi:tRNA(fMet)-specific endonuclease VapC
VTFLLDTNAVSSLIRRDPALTAWIASLDSGARLVICTIVRGEILFGLARLGQGKRRRDLEDKAHSVLNSLSCEPVPPLVADHYATVKAAQQRRGLPLDENDLWIAATALALKAPL